MGGILERTSLVAVQTQVDGYDAHARRHGAPGLDGWREGSLPDAAASAT
ncbi:hypothetical protein [Streptomyces sp. NRRL F-2580]|nr:hypothetical protein [Streptomyces sp. NRRL F-2580]